jgi:hypothetical protein
MRISNVLNCGIWVFSSPYAHTVSVRLPIKVKRNFVVENQFSAKPYTSKCCSMSVQNCKQRVLSSSVRACSNYSLYSLTRRRSRGIRHTVVCGMSSSRLARLMDLRRLRWKASLTRSTISSEGPGRPGRFAIHRHLSRWNFSYYCLCRSSPAGPFRTCFENVATPSRSTVLEHTQARKMPSLLASPFSLNLHPLLPPT